MKVLHVSTYDNMGGAAKAAFRLHSSLKEIGVNSEILVKKSNSLDPSVLYSKNRITKFIFQILPTLDQLILKFFPNRRKELYSPALISSSNITKIINQRKPDIVHLHWVVGGFLKPSDLIKINAPIVWTFHDHWPMTGGCHYFQNCEKYISGCNKCPILSSDSFDLSKFLHNQKINKYEKTKYPITPIALSNWMLNSISKSHIFGSHDVKLLPNPVDTQIFAPLDKLFCRELLNIPKDKILIAFGAVNPLENPNKGFNELNQAIKKLNLKSEIELLIFGNNRQDWFEHKAHLLGKLEDHYSLRCLYNAADIVVVPSKQETFGQVAAEALSCGTVVVGFNSSGLVDLIDHKKNGYLAEAYKIEDLANGIKWALENYNSEQIKSRARLKIINDFDSNKISKKYKEFYRSIILEYQNK